MAKKKTKAGKKKAGKRAAQPETKPEDVELTEADKITLDRITGLAGKVTAAARRKRDPAVDIPSRTLSNAHYNKRKRYIEMGKKTNARQLFNLHQAKSYMQTLLVARGCKDLIGAGKTISIRGMFYNLKKTIEGTRENTFEDQGECDPIIEDVEVLLDVLREELHLYATARGAMVGTVTLVDRGDEIDCSRMGSGGYAIPSIVEPNIIQFKECNADFVLHVEKDTVWQRFNEDRFWRDYNCILTHGSGQPSRGVRRLLTRFSRELNLPVYCLLDNDPWGYYIYSVIKQGSINLAFESQRMAVPDAKFLGLRSIDLERCELSEDVIIKMSDTDKKRAKQIAKYPWFEHKKEWQREIDLMLKNDFKLEVEALLSRDISYVTEVYVPERLEAEDWLD